MTDQYQLISLYMNRKLESYKRAAGESGVRAQLAQLRRGIGKVPGEMPELWGMLFDDMPEGMMATNGKPTKAEWAVYTALTLYALHQQGKSLSEDNMHKPGVRLGQAMAKLAPTEEDKERVGKRFQAFAASDDLQGASYYLRGLVQLLRAEGIGLDYVRLALDLYRFQSPKTAPSVRLEWGQDFYYRAQAEKNNVEEDNHAE